MSDSKAPIYVASDHGGFESKNALIGYLKSKGYNVVDVGPFAYDKEDDYPDYAQKACKGIIATKGKGILICRTGHGMTITANKMFGIYASLCLSEESARKARVDENTNVLVLAADFTTKEEIEKIAQKWLDTDFMGEERHSRRQNKFKNIEKSNFKGS